MTVGLKTPVKFGDPCGPNQSFLIFLMKESSGFAVHPHFVLFTLPALSSLWVKEHITWRTFLVCDLIMLFVLFQRAAGILFSYTKIVGTLA